MLEEATPDLVLADHGLGGAAIEAGIDTIGVADINDHTSVPVVYRGSVPDQFKVTRHIVVDGRYTHGTFIAKRDTLVTKCPSKYAPAKKA